VKREAKCPHGVKKKIIPNPKESKSDHIAVGAKIPRHDLQIFRAEDSETA
jgi:hypothetical protein